MKLFFCDIETTGLDPEINGIIQIAGTIVTGDVETSFSYDVAPLESDRVEEAALKVNGKTLEQVRKYPAADLVYQRLLKEQFDPVLDKYYLRDKFTFVAYNAPFDMGFMRAWFKKIGDDYFGSWFFYPAIDVMGLAAFHLRKQRALLKNFRLGTVAEYMGVSVDGDLHDAAVDIALTRKLYAHLEAKLGA